MKRLTHILLLTAIIFSIDAEAAVVTPLTRQKIDSRREMRRSAVADDADAPTHMPLILQIDEATDVAERLEALGTVIYNRRGDLLLTSIPLDRLEEALELDGIVEGASSGDLSSCMDEARPWGNVDRVLGLTPTDAAFYGIPAGLTGRGVVTGLCDTGFDPHHIAFEGRVGALYHYDATRGERLSAETPAQIADWVTDTYTASHATHVANIMAGGYTPAPYHGVAPGAEIVAATSDLSDVGILAGAEDIIAYAKACSKPAVINMSLSNYTGPHDGTDLMCLYLSRLAEDAVLFLSSGNTGSSSASIVATRQITADGVSARARLNSRRAWVAFELSGFTDIWNEDDTPLSVSIQVYDIVTGAIVYTSPVATAADGSGSFDTLLTAADDADFARFMDGKIRLTGQLSSLNGRYNVTVAYDITTSEGVPDKPWNRYYIVIAATTEPGRRVTMYADGVYSFFLPVGSDATTIGSDGSISNMATAPGVISVGSCNSRNTAPLLNSPDAPSHWDVTVPDASAFTSYSTGFTTSRPYPHIAAPGCYVVSAISYPAIGGNQENPWLAAMTTGPDGRHHFWGADQGTSMASPFAAGVAALWLEACPDLSADDICRIACETARTDFPTISDPRWGAGCIDALAGLSRLSGIPSSPMTDVFPPTVTIDHRGIVSVKTPAGDPLPFTLYSIDGRQLDPGHPAPRGLLIVNSLGANPVKTLNRR